MIHTILLLATGFELVVGSGNTLEYTGFGGKTIPAGLCGKFYGGDCPGTKGRDGMTVKCCVSYNAPGKWNPGSCESTPGTASKDSDKEQIGAGLTQDTCKKECKTKLYGGCEFHSGSGKCFRVKGKVTAANWNTKPGKSCYIQAEDEDNSVIFEAPRCTKNSDCSSAFGDGYYCAVKSHRADYNDLKGSGTICAPIADCCQKLDSVEGKCPTACFTTLSGSQYYKPTGMNLYLGGRPGGEGATSYSISTAMSRCNSKGDCRGITCNVNNQGFTKCELRRNYNTGFHNRGDCKTCLSYRKSDSGDLCRLVEQGAAPKGCVQKEENRFQFSKSTLWRDCQRKCLSKKSDCDTFVVDKQINYCYLYMCHKSYDETTAHSYYDTYACFDPQPEMAWATEEEAQVGDSTMYDASYYTKSEGTGKFNSTDFVVYGFAAVGLGFLLYGAGKHYSKGRLESYSTFEI